MDNFLARLLGDQRIPKPLRFLLLAILVGVIAYAGIMICLNSSMITGKIFGAVLALVILLLGGYVSMILYNH